jgi:PHD/YefM family antitoxin component YafN of YafNO toxin-antitoxin module
MLFLSKRLYIISEVRMQSIVEKTKPKYLIDEKGNKKAVVLDIKEYKSIMELIEDLEDANDLLRAERKATSFIPYDKFRKTWLKG